MNVLKHIADTIVLIDDVEEILADESASVHEIASALNLSPYPIVCDKQPVFLSKDDQVFLIFTKTDNIFTVSLEVNGVVLISKHFCINGAKTPPLTKTTSLFKHHLNFVNMIFGKKIDRDVLKTSLLDAGFEIKNSCFVTTDDFGNEHRIVFWVDECDQKIIRGDFEIIYTSNVDIYVGDCKIFSGVVNLLVSE